jgi:hypothetical protein
MLTRLSEADAKDRLHVGTRQESKNTLHFWKRGMDSIQTIIALIGAGVISNLLVLMAVLRIYRKVRGEKEVKLARPNRRPSNYK